MFDMIHQMQKQRDMLPKCVLIDKESSLNVRYAAQMLFHQRDVLRLMCDTFQKNAKLR